MNKKKALTALSLTGVVALIGLASISAASVTGTFAEEAPHTHSGNHYAELLPTGKEIGVKEYWVCCSCHEHFLTLPVEGTWTDAALPTEERAAIPQGDDRRVEPILPFVRDDMASNVSLVDNGDGSWTIENKTSGILSGNAQNWGESGPMFYSLYSAASSFGAKYLKVDVRFGEGIPSFNVRFGSGVGEFYVPEIPLDAAFPSGRQINAFDLSGKRVDRVSPGNWYTLYFELVGNNLNTFWTNGGSLESPMRMDIRNIEITRELNPSIAPYFKSGKGTVEIATEEGREGAFKLTKGADDAVVNFFGITHTSAPEVNEFSGGFFDSDDYRYLIFDYYVDASNSAWYVEAKGQGYASKLGRYCDKNSTAPDAKIYVDGVEVPTMQDGWNTCVVDLPHVGGGWTDFDFSLGGSVAYFRNLRYSTSPLS